MRFKRVYIEITNGCNLKCDFCIGNKREKRYMSFDEFKFVLDRVGTYTNYLYFHVLGEPLLHPDIVKFINYATSVGFYVNITTNGYLINRLSGLTNIRQLNISLHSFDERYGVSFDRYIDNIFNVIDNMSDTYISFRLWTNDDLDLLKKIMLHYGIDVIPDNIDGFRLSDRVYLSKFHKFVWPDLNNDYYSMNGRCYGLIDHIGILCDGSIVPCCLDGNSQLCLGNIFNDSLDDILKSDKVVGMIDGFRHNYKCEELCRHCSFLD